jgi:NADPH:quinone reductase-like Zn-dependent oxidoreductase
MALTGGMVDAWPFTPGCDAAGVIVEVGHNAVSALGQAFKKGEYVFGCTRVGQKVRFTTSLYDHSPALASSLDTYALSWNSCIDRE